MRTISKVCFLTPELFAELISPCQSCAFWEIEAVRRLSAADSDAQIGKSEWLTTVGSSWGTCGQIASIDRRWVGYVLYAPPRFLPGTASFPTAPISADAVQLSTLWVDPEYRGRGVGRALIQAVVKELLQRKQGAALEAIAARRPLGAAAGTQCATDEEFFHRMGFKTVREHLTSPRVRLDFRSVLTWRDGFGDAVDRVRVAIRPGETPMPQPASRTGATGASR